VHLENLQKTKNCLEATLQQFIDHAFFKVNNNQPMDLSQKRIMRCIICYNDVAPLEILTLHIRLKKNYITYHKFNGITIMKKHVNFDHSTLLKRLLEDASIALRSQFNYEPNKKEVHVSP
jgi:hypothetical protein